MIHKSTPKPEQTLLILPFLMEDVTKVNEF